MEQQNQQQPVQQVAKPAYGVWLSAIGILLFLTLPFHYVPGELRMFPKEHFTFSNTFISKEDVDALLKRFNEASILERSKIMDEPLFKKLSEKGIIYTIPPPKQDSFLGKPWPPPEQP